MTNTTNRLEQLIALLEETRVDHDKFFNGGNNAAGLVSAGNARGKGSCSGASRRGAGHQERRVNSTNRRGARVTGAPFSLKGV